MKKVIVTGSSGYVGSNLVDLLTKKGFEVFIIIRKKTNRKKIRLFNNLQFYIYDNKVRGLINFFQKVKPELVFHLASYFVSEHKSDQIDKIVSSNLTFGLHLLEAMKSSGTRKLINTGTSWQHFNNENYNPVCLYAASKQAFESLIDYYVKAEFFKTITLKLFDTYGENDDREKLLNLIARLKSDKEELKMSPGDQFINLTHISDVCEAFIIAENQLNHKAFVGHKKYAVSNKVTYKLKEVISLFESITGNKIKISWGTKNYRKREVMVPWNKGERLPKWNAKISLEEGLKNLYNYWNGKLIK